MKSAIIIILSLTAFLLYMFIINYVLLIFIHKCVVNVHVCMYIV